MPITRYGSLNAEVTSRTILRAVSPENPCPVCSGDHKCSVGENGLILCGRESGGVKGFHRLGPAKRDPQFQIYRRIQADGGNDIASVPARDQTIAPPATNWGRLASNYERRLTRRAASDLASALGLPVEDLIRMGVGFDKKRGCWTFPEHDADGRVIGIVRRFPDGKKRMMQGGRRGLYYASDRDAQEGAILIPEGGSDCLTLLSMRLDAVGRPSNTGGVELLADLLRDVPPARPIIILGENDHKPDGRWPGMEGVLATAEKLSKLLNRSIKFAFPPTGSKDARDWFRAQDPDLDDPAGLRKLGSSFLAAIKDQTQEIIPWDPILELELVDLPPFPVGMLSPWQRDYVNDLAIATQTPVDLGAMLVLAASAVALAKKASVRIRPGYHEPLNLFLIAVQPPASRKTSVFRAVTDPIEQFEREMAIQAAPIVAAARNQAEIDKRVIDELQRRASKEQDQVERANLIEQARFLSQDLASRRIPEIPRLSCDDFTPESLANRMAIHGGRIGVLSPEGDAFGNMGGRYTNGKSAANLGVYLKGHAGDPIRVDRMNRPPEHIDRPALTMGLAVQPDVIQGLASNPSFRGRGLLGRFLYAIPRNLVGRRLIDPAPVPAAIEAEYRNGLRALLALPFATDESGGPTEHIISLSQDAYSLWLEFAGWIEPQLGDFGELGHIADWAGKLAGAVIRIVGGLHLADHAGREAPCSIPIPGTTMTRAIEIGRYLIPHAKAAFAEMGADPTQADAKYLLAWVRRHGDDSFSRRDAFEATKGHFRTVEGMEPAIEILRKRNYIRPRVILRRSGPGRPKGPIFDVNPAALHDPGRSTGPMVVPDISPVTSYETGACLPSTDDLILESAPEVLGDASPGAEADEYEEGVI